VSLLLVVPLLGATAAAGAGTGPTRPHAADARTADAGPADAATGQDHRIAYAGTGHRSLGSVASTSSSTPLFGAGPTHFDVQPSALGGLLVFASRRDEPRPQVYLRSADGAVRKLTSGRDAAHPRLTPDGSAVVFDSAEPGGSGGGTQRDLWRVRTDGGGLTRLTDTPADEESPTVSPDGTRLAYSSDADPAAGTQIYVRRLAGGAATRISDPANGAATEPVWNPVDDPAHRDLVAYTASAPQAFAADAAEAADAADGRRLRVADGRTDRPLLGGDRAQWRAHGAAWLPDGDGLLFLSPETTCECQGDYDHVFRTTAYSADVPSLVLSEDREVTAATWLGPLDGGRAVVERDTAPQKCDATLQDVRPDGTDPRDLGLTVLEEDPTASTNTDPAKDPLFQPSAGYDPWTERQAYSPDGRRIAVTRFEDSDAGRIERIWTVDADGSHPAPLPLDGRGPTDWDTDPTFSPDGTLLAFTRTSPGGVGGPGRILVAKVATGEITAEIVPPAGQLQGQDAQPAWSPDGTALAFTRNAEVDGAGGAKHVWTVPLDDLDDQHDLSARNCPDGCGVIDDSPAWSPDGSGIVFNRKMCGCAGDQRNGLVLMSAGGGDCTVLLPAAVRDQPGACRRDLPDTTATGPYQPRDAAFTADGGAVVFTSRAAVGPGSPEKLRMLDLGSGAVTPVTAELPGRQKEPAVQQSVDLAVSAPGTAPRVTVGAPATVRVGVVNHGPAASPGTRLTVAPPAGVRVTAVTWPGGSCGAAALQCDVGVVPAGGTVTVSVTLVGDVPGDQAVGWSVTGAVVDPRPSDNAARTVLPVRPAAPPPTSPPPPPPTTPPPAPPAPAAGPGVHVTAAPNPGYVGGRVVVTYTVRNGRNALATGLRLRVGLPAGVPDGGRPPGCDASWTCALPDLDPGASTVLTVVLHPDRALTGTVTGVLTTTGTDADPGDNTARQRLRILQPRIVAVPAVGRPGFVTSVRGEDFPPGAPVRFTWKPGITAAAAPTTPGRDGSFIGQLLILAKDQTGPRDITAAGPGFSPVHADFLVVNGSVQPPDEVTRR
jgi:Tol biopolymer transport system component